jgi:hypothetical protein
MRQRTARLAVLTEPDEHGCVLVVPADDVGAEPNRWHVDNLVQDVNELYVDIERLRDQRNQLLRALDDMGGKMRMGDYEHLGMLAFIWEQNRDKILSGETTWQEERRSVYP